MKLNKKFYVATSSLRPDASFLHASIDDAIEEAKHKVAMGDECRYIVKVVAVVKQKPMPVIVEKIS